METFYPIDLGNIQDKLLAIRHALEIHADTTKTEEMKAVQLKRARDVVDTCIRDIDWLFDTKLFNGKRALGLDESHN